MTAVAVDTTLQSRRLRVPSVLLAWLIQIRLRALRVLCVELARTQPVDKCRVMHVLQGRQILIQLRPHLAKLA